MALNKLFSSLTSTLVNIFSVHVNKIKEHIVHGVELEPMPRKNDWKPWRAQIKFILVCRSRYKNIGCTTTKLEATENILRLTSDEGKHGELYKNISRPVDPESIGDLHSCDVINR